MTEYYVFQTKDKADECLAFINSSNFFPIEGRVSGARAPEDRQKTTKWAEASMEMNSGEFAIPRVPSNLLDYCSCPQESRDSFLEIYGQDIRTLQPSDFVQGE